MSKRVAICGYGQSGKDTVGAWLHANTGLICRQSTSEAAAELVFKEWGHEHYLSAKECWNDRRNNRQQWAEIIWRHNQPDGLTLYREMVSAGNNVLVGIRNKDELHACVTAGLVDISLWVERPGYEESPQSMTLSREDCDLTIWNDGTISELHDKLTRVAEALHLSPSQRGLPLTFDDQQWRLRFVDELPPGNEDNEGLCVYKDHELLVLSSLAGREKLEAVLHEMLHAAIPQASEDWVTKTAHELALAADRLGYRRMESE